MPRSRLLPALLLFAVAARPATISPRPAAAPIFRFATDDFWLALHHFLYVLGRAQNGEIDAKREAVVGAPADAARGLATLSSDEQSRWRAAASFYANGPSHKDLVFDDTLAALTRALGNAGDRPSLNGLGIDSATAATLESVAPIYRKAFWTAHHDANLAWTRKTQALVDQHGAPILAFILGKYRLPWPGDGYPIHVAPYSNWAGAYSTSGNLLVMASLDSGTTGSHGLEIAFHESMHQWDDSVFVLLRDQARAIGKLVPRNLSHAMIFYTAGEAVRREIPGHVPYAEASGIWKRGLGPFYDALRKYWQPYLDGRIDRDEALAGLVAATGVQPRP
jgi:hypothetical protein